MAEKIELNKEYIKQKIQNILNKNHHESQKKIIKEFTERYNIACPCCLDSNKSVTKKRGNLYKKNLFYKCFNCDIYMSFTKFCDTFNEPLDIEQRINIYNYIDENMVVSNINNDYIETEMDKLIDVDEFMNYFNNRKNSWLYDIKPIENNSHVNNYLKYGRLLTNTSQIYQGIYRIVKNEKTVFETRVMISMNMSLSTNKLIGIQLRNLESSKEKRFYKIVEFEELYNYINPTNMLNDLESISYNKLSHFYNVLNIDFEKVITVFEGFIDSLFYPNSIGLVGAKNKDDLLGFLINADADIKLQFFYDNDTTGIYNSTKLLKDGQSVFLWNKLFEKLIDKKKNKYDAKRKLNDIIDLNDLVLKAKNPNIVNSLKLWKFFSIDDLDLIYLDKMTFDKENNTWKIKR